MKLLLILAGLATLTVAGAFAATPIVPCSDSRGCPDLKMDNQILNGWDAHVSVEDWTVDDCAVQEGMVASGTRTLLRFRTMIANFGAGALNTGDPATYPDRYVYAPCHDHYHFTDMVAFRLWTKPQFMKWERLREKNPDIDSAALLDSHPELTPRASQKQGFCLEETFYYPGYDFDVSHQEYHVCQSLGGTPATPGINPLAADGYSFSLDGQWVDVTGLKGGRYVLCQEVNPRRLIEESNYLNNETCQTVIIPR